MGHLLLGHVEESDYLDGPDARLDEVYEAVAHRELFEELGVDTSLTLIAHVGPVPEVHYEQLRLYRGVHEGPYVAQVEEVEEIRVVDRRGLEELAKTDRVTPTLTYFVARWLIDAIAP